MKSNIPLVKKHYIFPSFNKKLSRISLSLPLSKIQIQQNKSKMPSVPAEAFPHAAIIAIPVAGGVFIVLLCFSCCYLNKIKAYFQKQQ